jgi:YHS domain-containing protein
MRALLSARSEVLMRHPLVLLTAALAIAACTQAHPPQALAPVVASDEVEHVSVSAPAAERCGDHDSPVERPSCGGHDEAAAQAPSCAEHHERAHSAPTVSASFDGRPADGTEALCLVMNRVFTVNKTATSTYQGKTYAFCCDGCKQAFDEQPTKYVLASHGPGGAPTL